MTDPSDEMSWEELFERLRVDLSGDLIVRDEALWAELLARLKRMAGAAASSQHWTTQEDLEDAVSAVTIRLQDPVVVGRIQRSEAFRGYLYVMVRNAVLDQGRRRRNERAALDRSLVPDLSAPETGAPFGRFEDSLLQTLRSILITLSASERALIRQRYWEHKELQAIADEMGISYSTAAVRFFRLLRKLRRMLKEAGEIGEPM